MRSRNRMFFIAMTMLLVSIATGVTLAQNPVPLTVKIPPAQRVWLVAPMVSVQPVDCDIPIMPIVSWPSARPTTPTFAIGGWVGFCRKLATPSTPVPPSDKDVPRIAVVPKPPGTSRTRNAGLNAVTISSFAFGVGYPKSDELSRSLYE
jgi:hypothetical protein